MAVIEFAANSLFILLLNKKGLAFDGKPHGLEFGFSKPIKWLNIPYCQNRRKQYNRQDIQSVHQSGYTPLQPEEV
jgi:hypothetical protein